METRAGIFGGEMTDAVCDKCGATLPWSEPESYPHGDGNRDICPCSHMQAMRQGDNTLRTLWTERITLTMNISEKK